MTGLLVLAVFLFVALVVVSALGFVFLAVTSALVSLLAKGAPMFGKVFRTAGAVVAAVVLALVTMDFATEQAELNPHIFAFVQSVDSSVAPIELIEDTAAIGDDPVAERLIQPDVTSELPENPDADTAKTKNGDLPNWVTRGLASQRPGADHDSDYIVLKSDLTVLREDADAHIRQQAAEVIRKDFTAHYAADVEWEVPAQVVEDAIRRSFYTTETVSLGIDRYVTARPGERAATQAAKPGEHELYRVYAQVDLSPSLRKAIYPGWRKLVAGRRLVKMGQGFGLVTLVIASLAMYLRYDSQTLGQKRGRLGLLSLAVLAGGSVVLGAIGDSIRSKLSAANIVEAEYCRDRVDQMDETVIGLNEGPIFEADDDASKIAIVIDSGQLNRGDLIRREMADYIETLSQNTRIDIHLRTNRRHTARGFHGGTSSAEVQQGIEELMLQKVGNPVPVSLALETVLRSDAQSVFMVTEDLADLTDGDRQSVIGLSIRSNLVPVSFIKVFDGKPTRLDDALLTLANRSGGYLRLLDALDYDE